MDMQAKTSISGTRKPAPPRQSGNARERMFEEYQPLARKLARRYAQTSVPLEDLQQVAYVGLLLAIDRFDPSVGRAFPSFAIPTILGEVRRHLRDHSRPVHVTRAAKERSAVVRRAREQLTSERGRPPIAQQIAQFLEMDLEYVIDGLLADATYDTKAFDEPVGETAEGATLADLLGEDDPGYNSAEARVVPSALEELGNTRPPRLADALSRRNDPGMCRRHPRLLTDADLPHRGKSTAQRARARRHRRVELAGLGPLHLTGAREVRSTTAPTPPGGTILVERASPPTPCPRLTPCRDTPNGREAAQPQRR